jgi:hypothetical protein
LETRQQYFENENTWKQLYVNVIFVSQCCLHWRQLTFNFCEHLASWSRLSHFANWHAHMSVELVLYKYEFGNFQTLSRNIPSCNSLYFIYIGTHAANSVSTFRIFYEYSIAWSELFRKITRITEHVRAILIGGHK